MTDIAHSTLKEFHSWSVPELLRLWWRRYQEREQLAHLTERDLRDIGLSRNAIYAELRKPFWRD